MKNYILYFFLSLFFFSSCNKEVNDPAQDETNKNVPTGSLKFHLHSYIGDNEVDLYNVSYQNVSGREIKLSLAQLYLSKIALKKADGIWYEVQDKIILKTLENQTYSLGNIPVGNYTQIRFTLGLNQTTNAADPTMHKDSLLLDRSEMWFNSSAQPDGFVYLHVQGQIDTSASLSGKFTPFVYKIGSAHRPQITMPIQNFSILKDQTEYAHLKIDFAKLFSGIELRTLSNLSVNNLSENALPLATSVSNNSINMFVYE